MLQRCQAGHLSVQAFETRLESLLAGGTWAGAVERLHWAETLVPEASCSLVTPWPSGLGKGTNFFMSSFCICE